MAKDQRVKLKIPDWMGPINDLIPNEVMFDMYRLNVWIGTFVSAYGMLTAMESASDAAKKRNSHGISLFTLAKMASPALFVADTLFDIEGAISGRGEGSGILINWKKEQAKAKSQGNDLGEAFLTLMSNDFYRRALQASAIASLVTYSAFETQAIEAAVSGVAEGVGGVGAIAKTLL
jgi:hypothetical protein